MTNEIKEATMAIGLFAITMYTIALFVGSLTYVSASTDTHKRINTEYVKMSKEDAHEMECSNVYKFNYVFPIQLIGCWLTEPIKER